MTGKVCAIIFQSTKFNSKNYSYTGKGTEINNFCNTKPISTKGKKSRDFKVVFSPVFIFLDCHFPSPQIALYRYRCKDRETRGSFSALTFQETKLVELGKVWKEENDSCCFGTSWANRDSWLLHLAMRSGYRARPLFLGKSIGFFHSPSKTANGWQMLLSYQHGDLPLCFHCSV